ncbi:14978_t:CDS:1 [Dentiscutata heterogama]|uniref:14978_t:CDS:1 n=1 Tax=Dentiscutata heterogama TaxID=1316150 RepID=A0ACA9LV71_9GLOM|nr:14978_t:CDS:1 [Dentiscutata heterogama]
MPFYDSSDDDEPSYKNKLLISARDRNEFGREYFCGNRDEYVSSASKVAFEKYGVCTENEISFGLKHEFMQKDTYKDFSRKSSITSESQSDAKFTYQQPFNFTSYEPKSLSGIVESGCVLYKGHDDVYASPKFEATTKSKLECEDTDGTTAKFECGGSFELGIYEQKFKANAESSIQQDDVTLFKTEASLETKMGMNGDYVDAKFGNTLFRACDENEGLDLKLLNASAEAKFGIDENGIEDMIKLGVNLVEAEAVGVKSKIGFNLDTGISVNKNGIEGKLEGFGVKLGKEIGVSTPFAEVSIDLEKWFGS